MRINKPQLFNGQYLASNDAILAKLFGPNGFTSGAQVFSPAEGAKFLSGLIPWSEADIPASNIIDRIYGDTIKISNAEDAKTISAYIDEKFAKVRTYSLTGDNYISATSSEVDGNVAFTLATDIDAISGAVITAADIKIQKDKSSDLLYKLYVAGVNAGEINIPKDTFLESGEYDEATNKLILNLNSTTGANKVEIPVDGLISEFTASNGVKLEGTDFQGQVDNDSESFLTVGTNGFKLAGVQTAIDTASGYALAEAKVYANELSSAVSGAAAAQFAVINNLIPAVSAQTLTEAKGYADVLSAAVSGAAAAQFTDEAAARTADDEYLSGAIDYVSGQVLGVAGYKVYDGTLSGDAWNSAASENLVKAGTVKTYIDDKVAAVVAGDLSNVMQNKVDKTQIANSVADGATSGLPTNAAVISYVTNYVGSHNGVYEAPAEWAKPVDTTLTGLYVSDEGETKFWNGIEYVATSEEVAEDFTDAVSSAIPTVAAVSAYVSVQVDSVKEYVEGEVAATVTAVNTKAVEMLETKVIFGTVADAQSVSGTVPGRVIAVYGADEEQCYPSISYAATGEKAGVSTIYADAPSAVYTVVYAKRIGQVNGVLPAYDAVEPTE